MTKHQDETIGEATAIVLQIGPAVDQQTNKPRSVAARKVWLTMIEIKDTENVAVAFSAVDGKGHPAKVDGKPEWSSSDSDIAGLIIADDGLSCVVSAGSKLGTARVTVHADADLGEGVKDLAGFLDVSVIAGEAVAISLTPGTPTPQ